VFVKTNQVSKKIMNNIGETELLVDPFHTDFAGKLNYCTLGKHLLNSAEYHAAARGFGMKALNDSNYTWVLSRLTIEMAEMPVVHEKFILSTWIENVYRLFTNRNYRISSPDGSKIYGYARSVWAMINYSDRLPVDLHQMHGQNMDKYACPEEECPIDKQGRVRPLEDDAFVRSIDMQYSDIDYNGHVNSIKYIEHICDLFPLDYYRTHHLKRIEMAYIAESYFGNTLSFYIRKKSEKQFEIEVRKNSTSDNNISDTVVRCLLIFE
jgi:acyl-ACP thioesterase